MTGDPNRPGYQPQYDPGSGLRVGHGAQFGIDLHQLYRAGRLHMPRAAAASSGVTTALHDERPRMEWAAAGVGHQPALRRALGLHEELHFAVRHTTMSLEATGEALVDIADLYVRTDEAATEQFRVEYGVYGAYDEPTLAVPPPPSDAAPHEETYDPPAYLPPVDLDDVGLLGEDAREGVEDVLEGARDGVVAARDAARQGIEGALRHLAETSGRSA